MQKIPIRFISSIVLLCMFFIGNPAGAEELSCALVKRKVLEAVKVYEEMGDKSFAVFKNPKSGFLFGEKLKTADGEDTYSGFIFVFSLKNVTLMHANNPRIDGVDFTGKRDKRGTFFIEDFVKAAQENKDGAWSEYYWPKRRGGRPHKKSSFVHTATHKGKTVVVGCGLFDIGKEECIRQTQ